MAISKKSTKQKFRFSLALTQKVAFTTLLLSLNSLVTATALSGSKATLKKSQGTFVPRVTQFFSEEEFTCGCGEGNCSAPSISHVLIYKLSLIRLAYGKPLIVSSGLRCKAKNNAVGGAPRSTHIQGLAADIQANSHAERFEIFKLALDYGITGIGLYKKHIHLDVRAGRPVIWFEKGYPSALRQELDQHILHRPDIRPLLI